MAGVFDMVGPIMIGPSSSHTAGAARLGGMARRILGERPVSALIELHGSFAKTYRGHGTDKALVAGLLGYEADDARLKDALAMARHEQLNVTFKTADLGDVHPNTAVLHLCGAGGRTVKVTGASIGGGNIKVTQIDGYAVELTGAYHTLITIHRDKPGVIAAITDILARQNVNIAFMRVARQEKGHQALAIIEADEYVPETIVESLKHIQAAEMSMFIPPL